ncbi:hypothetical protein BV22DRAFT_1131939 [Leucogyrophana mollusca]|uniref:Uncharacterized protein n=1 Tax=Leucogyrophana mollusca TaxID=85980 RepID=A0ACB8BAE6_9AGAM|nr:hypothetical protein BV22DRAFT_1131939 [Leucogyrophana mollusca]
MSSGVYGKSRAINPPGAADEFLQISASISLSVDPPNSPGTVWGTSLSSGTAGSTMSTSSTTFESTSTIMTTSNSATTTTGGSVTTTTGGGATTSTSTSATNSSSATSISSSSATTTTIISTSVTTSTVAITTSTTSSTSTSTRLSSSLQSSPGVPSSSTLTSTYSYSASTSYYTHTYSWSSSPVPTPETTPPPATTTNYSSPSSLLSSTPLNSPWTSTFTYTSSGSGSAITYTTASTGVLSTQRPPGASMRFALTPASIAGVTLGALGAIAFGVLWLFCARRRRRQLHVVGVTVEDDGRDFTGARGPLDDEVDDPRGGDRGRGEGHRAMEERYADILAALQLERSSSDQGLLGTHEVARARSPAHLLDSVPPSAYVPLASTDAGYAYSVGPSSISRTTTRERSQSRGPMESQDLLVVRATSGSSRAYEYDSAAERQSESMLAASRGIYGPAVGSLSSHGLANALEGSSSYDASRSASYAALQSVSSHGATLSTSSRPLLSPSSYGALHSISSYTNTERRRSLGETSTSPTSYRKSRHGRSRSEGEGSVGSVKAFIGRLRGGRSSTGTSKDRGSSGSVGASGPPPPSAPEFSAPPFTPSLISPLPASKETTPMVLEQLPEMSGNYAARPAVVSFVVSNPDSAPPSPFVLPSTTHANSLSPYDVHGTLLHLPAPTWPPESLPSPVPTEESRRADGLLDPRLQEEALWRGEGGSVASLRDFVDYSRPIGGHIKNRLYSWTTFGTQDTQDTRDSGDRTISPHMSLRDLEAGHSGTALSHAVDHHLRNQNKVD